MIEFLRGPDEAASLETVGRLSREGDRLLVEAKTKLAKLDEDIRRLERREAELLRISKNYQENRASASPLLEALSEAGLKANAFRSRPD